MTDEDPFELFRKTIEGFAGGTRTPPFGGFGLPMAPFPTGPGAGELTSPEAGTKQAVTQLYRSIEALASGNDSLAGPWTEFVEAFSGKGVLPETPQEGAEILLGTYQVWLTSLSQLLVESYTMQLVRSELITEDHRSTVRTQEWLWELSQSDREQLLLRCTDIDDALVEDMQAARRRRNELLYDVGSWETVSVERPLEDAQLYLDVLGRLESLVTDGEGYSFFPDGRKQSGRK